MRTGEPLSPEEIARRAPLWIALSDLFLDTEMREIHYRGIRDAALSGGFTAGEVKAILTDEVAPVVGANLLQVAGEWAMFDPDWVGEQVSAYLTGRPADGAISDSMLFGVQRMVLSHDWPKLERVLNGEPIETVLAPPSRSPRLIAPRLFWWGAAIIVVAVLVWALLE